MTTFEYLGTLKEFVEKLNIVSFCWNHDDLKLSSIPITIKTEEEFNFDIVCSKELSKIIRDYDVANGYSISSLEGSIQISIEFLNIAEYFVIKIIDGDKKYIRLSCVKKSRTI